MLFLCYPKNRNFLKRILLDNETIQNVIMFLFEKSAYMTYNIDVNQQYIISIWAQFRGESVIF